MNIKEMRADMIEKQKKDYCIRLDVGCENKRPNRYRILQEGLLDALYPLNKANDQLFLKGWRGVIRSQPLRSWLQVTPPCLIEVDVYEDKIMLLAEDTIATFNVAEIRPYSPDNILAFLPFEYAT